MWGAVGTGEVEESGLPDSVVVSPILPRPPSLWKHSEISSCIIFRFILWWRRRTLLISQVSSPGMRTVGKDEVGWTERTLCPRRHRGMEHLHCSHTSVWFLTLCIGKNLVINRDLQCVDVFFQPYYFLWEAEENEVGSCCLTWHLVTKQWVEPRDCNPGRETVKQKWLETCDTLAEHQPTNCYDKDKYSYNSRAHDWRAVSALALQQEDGLTGLIPGGDWWSFCIEFIWFPRVCVCVCVGFPPTVQTHAGLS